MISQLEEATSADEVDARLANAEADAIWLTSNIAGKLDHVIEEHGIGGDGSGNGSSAELLAEDLRKAVARDIEAIRGKAIAFADARKAALEVDAANAAFAVFEATKARATAAGAAIAKLAAQLKYYQGQAMSAETDDEKAAADAKVLEIETEIAELEEERAAAQKEATRLEEANNNSQALARLANEIATAKNATDEVVAGLVDTQDKIHARIHARDEAIGGLLDQADALRYAAETELDDNLVNARWAAFDAAEAAIHSSYDESEDDWRLIDEYETNIREVRNGFRITKAKLIAERTNAELMVAIKQDMNMAEDRDDAEARRESITAKLETAAEDKIDALNAEFE